MMQSSGRKPTIRDDKQGKHIPGHNNFQGSKSEWTHPDPQALLDKFGGTGVRNAQRELVDFGIVVGYYVDAATGAKTATKRGVIHYDNAGGAHIVPTRP
ncbi:MAG: polymorphic toxin type 50 domain-containing protein [Janthinobacterium lividum]